MEYELQFNPFVRKAGLKYKIIQITDITLHTEPKNPTTSIGKKIMEALRWNKPGRIYGSVDNSTTPSPAQQVLTIDLIKKDPKLLEVIREQEKNGYRVLLSIPKQLPILAGSDTKEFIKSTKGQRLLRWLARKNQQV